MRTLYWLAFTSLVACTNSPDPRVITGGGISDGEIDGLINVYIIDNNTYQPITDATVDVGGKQAMTDETGLVIFQDVSGPQTIAVKASGYRGAVWQGANGANVTIPVTKLGTETAQQATLSGTITGWDTISVATGHIKAALVAYSQNDDLGDPANNIQTPNQGNLCTGQGTTCPYTVITRTGTVTLVAAIVDYDPHGTATMDDDTTSIIGWATAPSVQVNAGVAQSGLTLTIVQAGSLQNATIDFGTPPAALAKHDALIGIELSNSEVVQLPVLPSGSTTALVPMTTVFAPNATYRLTAIAQTTEGDKGAQSIILRRGQATTTLAADSWLTPPTNVTGTRTSATFDTVTNAKVSSAQWSDPTGILLEITAFDNKPTLKVPDLLALPTTGVMTLKAQGIGADLDVNNFSLDKDKKLLWGVSAQPITLQ